MDLQQNIVLKTMFKKRYLSHQPKPTKQKDTERETTKFQEGGPRQKLSWWSLAYLALRFLAVGMESALESAIVASRLLPR